MDTLTVLAIGVGMGVVLAYLVLRAVVAARVDAAVARWMADEAPRVRRDAITRSRSALKGRVGEQLAPLLPGLGYAPSDLRFLGNPVDYVVFDGYSEVKEREADELDAIVFLEVKHGGALSRDERRVRDCVEAGRVRWDVIELSDLVDGHLNGRR